MIGLSTVRVILPYEMPHVMAASFDGHPEAIIRRECVRSLLCFQQYTGKHCICMGCRAVIYPYANLGAVVSIAPQDNPMSMTKMLCEECTTGCDRDQVFAKVKKMLGGRTVVAYSGNA